MKNDFKELSKKLSQGMNFKDNAVILMTLIDNENSCFQKGEIEQLAMLIRMALKKLYEKIDDEYTRDVLRDDFIDVLNEEVGIDMVWENKLQKKYASTKIEDMDFSAHSYNFLKRAEINTLQDLAKLSYEKIARIRNLGKEGTEEVIEKLREYGYEVRKNSEEV